MEDRGVATSVGTVRRREGTCCRVQTHLDIAEVGVVGGLLGWLLTFHMGRGVLSLAVTTFRGAIVYVDI